MDSLHLPLCVVQGVQVKLFYSCQSSWESLVLTFYEVVQEEQVKKGINYAVNTLL